MSSKLKILIVEDDSGICSFLETTLASNGYGYLTSSNGKAALCMVSSHCPDCILLDLGLPDMDGNEIIRSVRSWSKIPIIVISARTSESDKATALDLGADDYLSKPFGTVELLARIRTALRHTRTSSSDSEVALTESFHVGDLCIDFKKRRVSLGGIDVPLTPNEYRIVELLGLHAGQVMTYKQMLTSLWGPSIGSDNKLLRVHMTSIRHKIEPNPNEPMYFMTEVGVGYRLVDEVES
ncbi:MAG: response regulator transcription factor [Sphaerochaetaceae bacterium]|jgi:two-component system KDP operon response regulator KdpE|nr:response regulator transcription factor [Sphaerochaetaceae bacterium]MDD3163656.1 response regulator transcription factor [Sphaerochaetaceae bacterium]MDD4007868.1 response regulator transcription factor [Sphaerochaetaceae bacterium]MDD4397257.1 response regulator transcription factor [Sphaerochaetaceae bacterium]